MIIDSHQHFWNYDPIKDSWIDDSMSIIRKNFLPKDLEPIQLKMELMDALQFKLTNLNLKHNF